MSNTLHAELKSCPFCGSAAKLCIVRHREYPSTFYVKCTAAFTCRVQTPEKTSPHEAIRIWNRRKKCIKKQLKGSFLWA